MDRLDEEQFVEIVENIALIDPSIGDEAFKNKIQDELFHDLQYGDVKRIAMALKNNGYSLHSDVVDILAETWRQQDTDVDRAATQADLADSLRS